MSRLQIVLLLVIASGICLVGALWAVDIAGHRIARVAVEILGQKDQGL